MHYDFSMHYLDQILSRRLVDLGVENGRGRDDVLSSAENGVPTE